MGVNRLVKLRAFKVKHYKRLHGSLSCWSCCKPLTIGQLVVSARKGGSRMLKYRCIECAKRFHLLPDEDFENITQ